MTDETLATDFFDCTEKVKKFLQVVGSMKEGTRNDYETLLMNNLPIN